jgi:hypothetical protein
MPPLGVLGSILIIVSVYLTKKLLTITLFLQGSVHIAGAPDIGTLQPRSFSCTGNYYTVLYIILMIDLEISLIKIYSYLLHLPKYREIG